MANFIDIFVEDLSEAANMPDWQEVFLAEDVKEGSGVTEEESGEADEPVIDVAQCVQVKGDAQKGYYLEFVDDIDDKLDSIYKKDKEKYTNLGIENFDDFKQMLKAEIATEFPSFGGVVTSDNPISNGTEAEAGGNEKAGEKSSSGGTGTYEWPVKKHTTPEERGSAITSIKADRASPGGVGSTHHQGMDIAASTGDEIVSIAAGTVTVAGSYYGYGLAVVMELDGNVNGKKATVTYGHNSEIKVNVGDKVKPGQTIALAGSTGNSTGPHCHLQVNLEGEDEAIDPLHLYTDAQVNSPTCSADNNNPPNGPVKGDGLYCGKGGGSTTGGSTSSTTTSNSSSTGSSTSSSSSSSGEKDIVAAAQHVHSIIENGYTYGPNPSLTVEESEASGRKTVDCTTYVDWVLNEIGYDVQNRYADQMKQEFEAADWAEAVSQENVEAGDIVLFSGHAQIYGGNEGGSDVWYNAGSTAAISTPAPSGQASGWSRGPIGIYRIAGATNNGSKKGNVYTPTGVPGSGWKNITGSSNNENAKITIGENQNIKEDPKNRFQGSVKVRRLTPKKSIGAYEEGDEAQKINDEVYNKVPEIPGMGKAMDLSEAMKGTIKGGSLSGSVNASNLAYLSIPYYDFDLKLHEGHMIVNKKLVEDVLNIFYELYDKKYPMASIEIAENFLDSFDSDKFYADAAKQEEKTDQEKKAQELIKNAKLNQGKNNAQIKEDQNKNEENKLKIENEGKPSIDRSKIKRTSNRSELGQMSADSNNTCCLYYDNSGGAAHITGNAIDINPRYNPKTTNKTSTATYNAQYYVDREHREAWNNEAEAAFIDKESVVYKVFESYGWTWGGEDGDYGHFEKTDIEDEEEEETEEVYIDSTYYDLSYVDEKTFNSYVKTGDKRALYVYTLNSTRDIITGAWEYDNSKGDKKFTVSKTAVGVRKALNKYTMPMELLLAVLVNSKDVEFTKNLAQLGIDSQYVVTIKDGVTTKKTITKTTVNEITYDAEGNQTGETEPQEETKEVITESTKQEPEVTFIDNWFVRYVNLFPGATEELISADSNLGSGIDIEVLGTRKTTPAHTTSTISNNEEIDTNTGQKIVQGPTNSSEPEVKIEPLDPNKKITPINPSTDKSNPLRPYNFLEKNNPLENMNPLGLNTKDRKMSTETIRIAMKNRKMLEENKGKEKVINTEVAEYKTDNILKATAKKLKGGPTKANADLLEQQRQQENIQKGAEALQRDLQNKNNTTGIIDQPNQEQEQAEKKPSKTTNITTETDSNSITYNYASTTGFAYENYRHFVELYKESGLRSASNNFVTWICATLEGNLKTANLVEVIQYLYSKVISEYYSMSGISFNDEYSPDEFGFQQSSQGGNSETPGMIPLDKPVLSREKFIEALNAYRSKSNASFATNFADKAGSIYDTAVAAGVNPELVVVTAKQEQNFIAGGGTHNYWGIGVFNGSNTGRGFASVEEGVKAYAKVLDEYEEGGTYAGEITQLAQEREAAGCDPTGYGPPGSLAGMQSVYSSLGVHGFGGPGTGGAYYMDPDRAGCTKIYKTHEEFVTKCQSVGGEHADGAPVTAYEGGQFTAYQVEMKIDFWNEIFGAYGSLS